MIRDLIQESLPFFSEAMNSIGVSDSEWLGLFGKATVEDHADVALPCHALAKVLRRSPTDIAQEICNLVSTSLEEIAEVSYIGGFVNLKAKPSWLSRRLMEIHSDDRIGVKTDQSLTYVVDYSAPNVAKEMHVGHLRSTVIGDTIVRMLEFKGHKVIRENHIGDWGTPFGMLIEHLLDLGEDVAANELGVGDLDSFYKQAREKFVSDSEFAERSRGRVVKLQGGDSETLRLWRILVDESMRYFNEVYSMLGVLLENEDIRGESSYQDLLPIVVDRLSKEGILENSDGADVVFPGGWYNREGEPLPMIIGKGDGGYNYSTSDLACIIDRIERLKCDRLLYIVGTPQKQHFEMVFQVAAMAGFMPKSSNATHVNFGSVLDTNGKVLKSREGEVIKLHDLLRESINRANEAVSNKNPDLDDKEREEVAKLVGIGAVKFADLSTERTKDYVFDWERMLSFDGNSAPYLQYAYARICSIFRRWPGEREKIVGSRFLLYHPDEIYLSRKLVDFPSILEESIQSFNPHKICFHLLSIASSFATFYENCKVLKSDDENSILSRLSLCDLTARQLQLGLGLLGIGLPERM